MGGFHSLPPDNPGIIESRVDQCEGDGGVSASSGKKYIIDEGEKDHASSPMASGAFGDTAGDGMLSSQTPENGIQQHQQDVIAHDQSRTGGLEAAPQAASTRYNGVVDVQEDGNYFAEGGITRVESSETPDDERTRHYHQEDDVIAHNASGIGGLEATQQEADSISDNREVTSDSSAQSGLVGALRSETPDGEGTQHQQDVGANDPLQAGGLKPAQQEAGIPHSEADDVPAANGFTDSGLLAAGVFLSETHDERAQHHQQGVIAHDVSHAGDLEAAQTASIPEKGDVESADGSVTAQETGKNSGSGGVEGANGSADRGSEVVNLAGKSSADVLPVKDGVSENIVEQRQLLEDADELYDIDDLEMSASEDI